MLRGERKFHWHHLHIVIVLCSAQFIHSLVLNGTMNVIISSLQKEFYLKSKDTGLYISLYDVGSLMAAIFVPIMGTRGSKPKWIAFGMFMLFVGCLVNVAPHFLKPRLPSNITINGSIEDANDDSRSGLCTDFKVDLFATNHTTLATTTTTNINIQQDKTNPCMKKNAMTSVHLTYLKYVLFVSSVLNGMSSASVTTLAYSYIEDIAPSNLATIYESVYIACDTLGMGVGFMLTSQFLNIHTDFFDIYRFKTIPVWMKPDHPNWIGAWWLPFMIFGCLGSLFGLVIVTFPKRMYKELNGRNKNSEECINGSRNLQKEDKDEENPNDNSDECLGFEDKDSDDNEKLNLVLYNNGTDSKADNNNHNKSTEQNHGEPEPEMPNTFFNTVKHTGSLISLNKRSYISLDNISSIKPTKFKQIVQAALKLLKSPIFICVLIASSIEGLLLNSFMAFISLFLEYQHRLATGTVSLNFGLIAVPSAITGSLFSGYLIKRFKWEMKECMKFLCCLISFQIFIYIGFTVSCKEPNFIFNHDFASKKFDSLAVFDGPAETGHNKNELDCYTNKAMSCDCDKNIFKPVCMRNSHDIVFESPCIAGCTYYDKTNNQYSNCTYAQCMSDKYADLVKNTTFTLDNGLCAPPVSCKNKLYVTYATIFILIFTTAMVFIPSVKVTIGCVASHPEMNAIALGLRQLSINMFGTIPGPIIFGFVIDMSCKYWYTDCLNQKVCKVYDNNQFAMSYGFLGIGFKITCWISVVTACVILKFQSRAK